MGIILKMYPQMEIEAKTKNLTKLFLDFLHILKLARKRLIQCSITMKNYVEHLFSNKTIEAVLK